MRILYLGGMFMDYVLNSQALTLKEIARQMRIANTMNMLRELCATGMISEAEYRDELQKLKPAI